MTDEDEYEFDEDDEPGSRLPLLIALACIVLVVVGAGAYLYADRNSLFGSSGSGQTSSQVASTDTSSPSAVVAGPEAGPAEPEKRPDRLTNGTDTAPAAADSATAGSTAATADNAAGASSSSATQTPSAPASGAAAPTTSPQGLPLENLSSLSNDNTATNEAGTNLVQQKAIYYYQGAQGQPGQANDGSATWAQITKDGRPAIQATLKIPERNVTVTVTIYKNYDASLPASHLVEVQFFGALSDSPIQRVPALVLKQTEQARGEPLAGAAVPVTNELFWIALSDAKDDVDHNLQLLKQGSWFDIPILFSDQTRALITFEKGVPGDKVFDTVMASWTPS